MKLSLAYFTLTLVGSSTAFFTPVPSTLPTSLYSATETTSGVQRNGNFAKLAGGYLFPEIARRRNAFLEKVCRGGMGWVGWGRVKTR
jgi:LL-diaminopimelate aminotransferase